MEHDYDRTDRAWTQSQMRQPPTHLPAPLVNDAPLDPSFLDAFADPFQQPEHAASPWVLVPATTPSLDSLSDLTPWTPWRTPLRALWICRRAFLTFSQQCTMCHHHLPPMEVQPAAPGPAPAAPPAPTPAAPDAPPMDHPDPPEPPTKEDGRRPHACTSRPSMVLVLSNTFWNVMKPMLEFSS